MGPVASWRHAWCSALAETVWQLTSDSESNTPSAIALGVHAQLPLHAQYACLAPGFACLPVLFVLQRNWCWQSTTLTKSFVCCAVRISCPCLNVPCPCLHVPFVRKKIIARIPWQLSARALPIPARALCLHVPVMLVFHQFTGYSAAERYFNGGHVQRNAYTQTRTPGSVGDNSGIII